MVLYQSGKMPITMGDYIREIKERADLPANFDNEIILHEMYKMLPDGPNGNKIYERKEISEERYLEMARKSLYRYPGIKKFGWSYDVAQRLKEITRNMGPEEGQPGNAASNAADNPPPPPPPPMYRKGASGGKKRKKKLTKKTTRKLRKSNKSRKSRKLRKSRK